MKLLIEVDTDHIDRPKLVSPPVDDAGREILLERLVIDFAAYRFAVSLLHVETLPPSGDSPSPVVTRGCTEIHFPPKVQE